MIIIWWLLVQAWPKVLVTFVQLFLNLNVANTSRRKYIFFWNNPPDLLLWNEVWTLTSFDLQTSANLPVASSSTMSTTLLISVKFIILMCFIGLYPVTSIQVCSPRCNFWFWKSPFVNCKCKVIYIPKTSSSILRAYLSLGEHRHPALPCCWYPRGEECQHHQGLDRHLLHQHPVEIRRTYQNLYPYLLKIPLSRRFDSFFYVQPIFIDEKVYVYVMNHELKFQSSRFTIEEVEKQSRFDKMWSNLFRFA